MPENLKNSAVENTDMKKEKIIDIDKAKVDFQKTFDKEQEITSKEETDKKTEGNADVNLNNSLYPTEGDVSEWIMDTMSSIKKIEDVNIKKALNSMLKSASNDLYDGDLDGARETLTGINDMIKELNTGKTTKNEKGPISKDKMSDMLDDDELMYKHSNQGMIEAAAEASGKTQEEIAAEIRATN